MQNDFNKKSLKENFSVLDKPEKYFKEKPKICVKTPMLKNLKIIDRKLFAQSNLSAQKVSWRRKPMRMREKKKRIPTD